MATSTTNKTINQGLQAAWRNPEAIENREFIKGLEKAAFGSAQPAAIDLECAVLGAVLLDKNAIHTIDFLNPDHFYLDKHAIIFDSCLQMQEKGIPIDLLTVNETLKKTTKWKISGLTKKHFKTIEKVGNHKSALDAIGGAHYLVELTSRVGSSANMEYHARIVYQKYLFREGIKQAARFIGKAYAEEGDVFELRNDLADSMIVNSPTGYFKVRTWNQVLEDASKQPDMSRLAGELLHKGSITIMFAPPGVGKSIGGVQLGNAIASGTSMFPGILVNELGDEGNDEPMKLTVGFIDMELFDKEVEKRYTNEENRSERFHFAESFIRISPNEDFTDYPDEDFDKFLNRQIETFIRQYCPEVLIVDNLTALSSESASDINVAIKIMRFLKKLRTKYHLTIFVIGHTTKYGNKMEKLTMSAMKGASSIQDFAPTIFGISENYQEEGSYYLKQLKGRNGQMVYGESNVIKYRIKSEENMLKWQFDGTGHEDECLNNFLEATDQDDYVEAAVKLKHKEWHKGWREVKKAIGYPFSHVTLMNRCKEYVAGSTQYEFDPRGNIVATEEEPTLEVTEKQLTLMAQSPNLKPDQKANDDNVPF